MKEKFEIKNCFEFVCPLKWENLENTSKKDVKYCGSCDKQVFRAKDYVAFKKLSEENKCVAYRVVEDSPGIMGETVPSFRIDAFFGKEGSINSDNRKTKKPHNL